MDFLLTHKEHAQTYWIGFLVKTILECERKFSWITFILDGKKIIGKGTLEKGGRQYYFTIEYSPFNSLRFDRIHVESKRLKKSFKTHFNGDGTLCLYHPIFDLNGRSFIDLVDIIPWISEWVYYYDKYLEYNIWLGPEHPHNLVNLQGSLCEQRALF